MLKAENLSVKLAETGKIVISNANLTLDEGEISLMMGPNGAGKSTFAKALVGWPGIEVDGRVELNGHVINDHEIDERARLGLFYGHQIPVEVPGVHLVEFIRNAYNSQHPNEIIDPWSFSEMFESVADELGLGSDFSDRNLNEGFSGGEKKKCEVLQMILLRPKYAVLDEIDSGLDIDSLKNIFIAINKFAKENKAGVLVISHNPKILDYLSPDTVHLLIDGKIADSGDIKLAEKILTSGYTQESRR